MGLGIFRAGRVGISAGVLLGLGLTGLISGDSRAQQAGQVFRGLVSTGIWVELAHDGGDRYELAILDGLPGQAPETRFVTLATDRSGGTCRLRGVNGEAEISACPEGSSFGAEVAIGQSRGRATLQTVGWAGSFAWGQAASGVGRIRATCQLAGLAGAPGLAATPLGAAVAGVAADARSLTATQEDLGAVLTRLRSDRLRAYSVIALSPTEAAEAQRLEDAVAGRPVLGRTVPLAQATREHAAFNGRIANSPPRERAREELRQVDRALGEIYDPTTAATQRALLERLENERLPTALRALESTLNGGQPGAIGDLVAWDAAAGELDACVRAIADVEAGARAAVGQTLVRRADELVREMQSSVSGAGSSTAGREVLQRWEANATVVNALRQAGRSEVFASLQGEVTRIALAEERARLEGERRAAQQAAADRIAPTTARGGRFQPERVSRSVVLVATPDGTGTGFIVAPGVVVTNAHVVGSATAVVIIPNGATASSGLRGQVDHVDRLKDIAVIRTPGLSGRALAIAGIDPPQGADMWSLGFPGIANEVQLQEEQTASLSSGIVSRTFVGFTSFGRSNTRGVDLDTRLLQHTAETAPGNSGGPLFDACHRVIGVHTQSPTDRGARTPTGVSSTELPAILRAAGVTVSVSNSPC